MLLAVSAGCSTAQTPPAGRDAGGGADSGNNATGGQAGNGSGGAGPQGGAGGTPGTGGAGGVDAGPAVDTGGAATGGRIDAPVTINDANAPELPAPASDCPAGALICDDFEGYAAGGDLSPKWTTQIIGGTVAVETSKAFRGSKAVRVTTTSSPANEPVRTHGGPLRAATLIKEGAPLFPVAGNAFFGRVMVWLTDMPPGGVHFSNIEAAGKFPDGRVVKYGEGGMFEKLMVGYTIRPRDEFDLPTVDCAKTSPTGVPEKRWVCIEWQFDGTNDEMHMWFDGQLQTAVDIVKTGGGCSVPWRAPPFSKLFLGWRHSQPSTIPVEMWMDNVVIDTKRVGCPTAAAAP